MHAVISGGFSGAAIRAPGLEAGALTAGSGAQRKRCVRKKRGKGRMHGLDSFGY